MPYGDMKFWKPNPGKWTSSKMHLFIKESNNNSNLPREYGWFSITWSLPVKHGFLSKERPFSIASCSYGAQMSGEIHWFQTGGETK